MLGNQAWTTFIPGITCPYEFVSRYKMAFLATNIYTSSVSALVFSDFAIDTLSSFTFMVTTQRVNLVVTDHAGSTSHDSSHDRFDMSAGQIRISTNLANAI